jgi:hypothetical protein
MIWVMMCWELLIDIWRRGGAVAVLGHRRVRRRHRKGATGRSDVWRLGSVARVARRREVRVRVGVMMLMGVGMMRRRRGSGGERKMRRASFGWAAKVRGRGLLAKSTAMRG